MIRLENVLKISFQDVLKMSSKRLEDVLKMSWRRFCKTSWRRLEDVLKTSWRRLEDVWPRRIYWSWPRRLEDVLKTYGQDEYIGLDQDVLKTSSEDVWLRRICSSWSRRLEDVFIKTNVCWVMMMKRMMMNCFCGMFDQRNVMLNKYYEKCWDQL